MNHFSARWITMTLVAMLFCFHTSYAEKSLIFSTTTLNRIPRKTNLIIDGSKGEEYDIQGSLDHNHPMEFGVSDQASLKLINMSNIGNVFFNIMKKGKVELENAQFYGCMEFMGGTATLTSVRAASSFRSGYRFPYIKVWTSLPSNRAKLTLDKSSLIEAGWRVHTTNADVVVDCDYYDAEVEAFATGSASFSGKGTGKGEFIIVMRDSGGKATVNANAEKLTVYFQNDGKVTKKQTVIVKGSAKSVEIQGNGLLSGQHEAKLDLDGVEQLEFVFSMRTGENENKIVKDVEATKTEAEKSAKRISLKKVKDADGQPIKTVLFRYVGNDADGKMIDLQWQKNLD